MSIYLQMLNLSARATPDDDIKGALAETILADFRYNLCPIVHMQGKHGF